MTAAEQREAARQFVNRWLGKGKEDEHGRSYWIELLSNVLGMSRLMSRRQGLRKLHRAYLMPEHCTRRHLLQTFMTRSLCRQSSEGLIQKMIRRSCPPTASVPK